MREELIRVDRENPIIRVNRENPIIREDGGVSLSGRENKEYPYYEKNREYPYRDNGEMAGKYRDTLSKKGKKVKIANKNKSIIISAKYI